MRGLVFLTETILMFSLIITILSSIRFNYPRYPNYQMLACDIATVIEGKRTITPEDIEFLQNFIPSYSYFEIDGRIYYKRDGINRTIYSCKIGDTIVKIGS